MNALAVSYAFEGNAKESASFYQKTFDKRWPSRTLAPRRGRRMRSGACTSKPATSPTRAAGTRPATSRRAGKRTRPPPSSTLWEFRWLHAQGRICARAGQPDDAHKAVSAARALLDRTPSLKDETPSWHYLAGYVDLYAKNYANADRASCNRRTADDPFVLSLLARAYEGAGKADQARETWARRCWSSNGHSLQNAFAQADRGAEGAG